MDSHLIRCVGDRGIHEHVWHRECTNDGHNMPGAAVLLRQEQHLSVTGAEWEAGHGFA